MNLEQSNPLVTVYIPTFNRVELLKRAVESVRQQTYQNLEIIIVDDCSTDGTHEYLKDISNKDSRIRFFLKEKNSGACVSRNIAIENAKGEYITGLDDDDYFLEERIAKFIKKIYQLKKYKFLVSRYYYNVNDGNLKKSLLERIKPKRVSRKDILSNNYIGNQIFIKTDYLKKNKFNSDMRSWQDLYCWYGLLSDRNAYILNDFTYVMDMSHGFVRISQQKIEKIEMSYEKFCKDYSLTYFQRKVLKNQLFYYGLSENKTYYKLLAMMNSFCFYSVISLLVSFYYEVKK